MTNSSKSIIIRVDVKQPTVPTKNHSLCSIVDVTYSYHGGIKLKGTKNPPEKPAIALMTGEIR